MLDTPNRQEQQNQRHQCCFHRKLFGKVRVVGVTVERVRLAPHKATRWRGSLTCGRFFGTIFLYISPIGRGIGLRWGGFPPTPPGTVLQRSYLRLRQA